MSLNTKVRDHWQVYFCPDCDIHSRYYVRIAREVACGTKENRLRLAIGQIVYTTIAVFGGAEAVVDTVEFYAYLVVAIMVPVGAGFWALVERNRWSTVILGVAALTVAVMLVRMNQIWTGSY